ncbi:MAG TPA: CDP-archaeol synthase [Bacteroidales bacterium]|nr:CDP-archaeol synthase [Bacteroidales bacterium]
MNRRILLLRSATGVVYIALVVLSIFLGPKWFAVLFFVFSVLSLMEYLRLALSPKEKLLHWLAIILGIGLYWLFTLLAFNPHSLKHSLIIWLFLMIPVLFSFSLFIKSIRVLSSMALTFLGIFYIIIPFALLNFIGSSTFSVINRPRMLLLSFFIFVWINDTFAYLIGVNFGHHRLFERISPAKSWEGALGGILFTIMMGFLFSYLYKELTILQWIGMAFITSIFGIFGDLSESLIKRNFGIKDSGEALPGHGGFLDRFDSILFASPAIFCYLVLTELIIL